LAGPVKKPLFTWCGGMLLGLGVSPEAGVGQGGKEREIGPCRRLQGYGTTHEAQTPGVGMPPWCWSHLGGRCDTTVVTSRAFGPCRWLSHLPGHHAWHRLRRKPRQRLARDEASVLFSQDNVLLQGSINLATVAAD